MIDNSMNQEFLDSSKLRAVTVTSPSTTSLLVRRNIRILQLGPTLTIMALYFSSSIGIWCTNRATRHPMAAFGLMPLLVHRTQQFKSRRRFYHTTLAAYKKASQPINDGSNQELTWETFEFSQSPKFDKRFTATTSTISDPSSSGAGVLALGPCLARNNGASTDEASKQYSLERLHQLEAQQDVLYQKQQHQQLDAWEQLDSDLVHRATAILQTLVQQPRVQRIEQVLRQRTAHTRFLFESMC